MGKKEIVIDTARDLFTKYGYKKVSMDEIAKVSGVTKKTIYSYFKDKDTMFKFFIEEELDRMREILEHKKKNHSLIEFISYSLEYMLKYRNNSLLVTAISKEVQTENNEKCNEFLKLYDDEIIKHIESQIEICVKNKEIKKCDAHLTAFIIYKIYVSIMFEYDKEINSKKVTQEVISILKDGLLN